MDYSDEAWSIPWPNPAPAPVPVPPPAPAPLPPVPALPVPPVVPPIPVLTMGDELMPLAPLEEDDEMEDLPPLENEDEEFHSLIEDALLEEQSGTSESSFEEMDTREASLMLASPEKEKPKDAITPQKPPVEFQRFAMVKPGPSVESPICAKPKPFVLQPAKPLGPSPTGTRPKQPSQIGRAHV